MVDLFVRDWLLKDAHARVDCKYPNEAECGRLRPSSWAWELGVKLQSCWEMFSLNPSSSRDYLICLQAAGHGLRIQYVRTLTRERGLTSSPECSFVEHKSKIRHFVVDDQAHPDTIKFLEELAEDIPRLDTSLKQNLFSTTLMMKLSKIWSTGTEKSWPLHWAFIVTDGGRP